MSNNKDTNKQKSISDKELMLALFGEEVDKRQLEEVKKFADYVKYRGVSE